MHTPVIDAATSTAPAGIAGALIAGIPDGVLAFDRECRYTLWNPAMERITGMPARDVLGRVATERFAFLAEIGEIAHFHAALRGESSVSREQRFRVPETGSWGFFDGHYFPIWENGSVAGGCAVIRNVTGRRRNAMRASAQTRVSQILVEGDARGAPARMLAAIGESTGWDCGAYWEVDETLGALKCEVTWRIDPSSFDAYIAASRNVTFAPGDGLPGRAWQAREAAWIEDILAEPRYASSQLAMAERLRSALAFPILVGGKAIGIMEFFSRARAERDADVLRLIEDLGAQFGQFVERRRVEGSFNDSQASFRAVFEQAPFTIQVFTPDGRCIDANPAFEKMWNTSRDALAGYNLLRDPQLEALGIAPRIRRAFSGEEVVLPPVNYDPARNNMPGRGRWTEASLYPIHGPGGDVSRVVLMHRDVTERIQLERAQAAAQLGTWDLDLATGQVQWSEGIYALLGLSADSFAPTRDKWRDFLHPEDRARIDQEFAAAIEAGGSFNFEFRIVRADGDVRWFASIGRFEQSDTGVAMRMLGVNIDITARKEAEIARGRRVDEVRILLDTLPVGVLIAHDPDCRRITGNRAANRLMRFDPDTNISKTPGDGAPPPVYRSFRDGTELPLDELPLRRALAGKPVENAEYQLCFVDGSCVDLLVSAAALHDERGEVRGAVATLLDITEQKRTRQALQDADRRKTEFIATLAHELRNPLAPIRNAVSILRLRDTTPEMNGLHEIMERQLRHMVRLVDDLLDVSRITRGRLELRQELVALAAIVEQAVEAARPVLEREGHAFDIEVAPTRAWLDADAVRIVQAIVNLLNNAAKYTPRGGRIGLRAGVEDNEAVIRVTDNGIGMSPEQLANAFDMFWQAGDPLGRSHGGLGIGLSLARTVAQMHGGRLEARSDGAGKGCEFTLRVPLASPPAQESAR